jgi:hypothetical protein
MHLESNAIRYLRFKAKLEDQNFRIDQAVSKHFSQLSRNQATKRIFLAKVNSQITSLSSKLKPNQIVELWFNEEIPF